MNVAGPGLGLSAPLDGGLLADRLKGTHLPLQTPAGAGCKEQLLGLEEAAVSLSAPELSDAGALPEHLSSLLLLSHNGAQLQPSAQKPLTARHWERSGDSSLMLMLTSCSGHRGGIFIYFHPLFYRYLYL